MVEVFDQRESRNLQRVTEISQNYRKLSVESTHDDKLYNSDVFGRNESDRHSQRQRQFPKASTCSPGSIFQCDVMMDDISTSVMRSFNENSFTVEIAGSTFKGFMVAAIDPDTHKRIGRFQEVKGTQPLPCSAVTHSDGQLKKRVSLLWVPPTDVPKGNVVFMATVVKSYSNYYANLIASVPVYTART